MESIKLITGGRALFENQLNDLIENGWVLLYDFKVTTHDNIPIYHALLEKQINHVSIISAMKLIDDYINAGSKIERSELSIKAKDMYKEFYGKEYKNRSER